MANKKGSAGGQALAAKYGPEYFKELGRRGGQRTKERHGSEHFSAAGKLGYEAVVERHFGGDREAANAWLAAKGQASIDEQYAEWGFNYFKDPGPHPALISNE